MLLASFSQHDFIWFLWTASEEFFFLGLFTTCTSVAPPPGVSTGTLALWLFLFFLFLILVPRVVPFSLALCLASSISFVFLISFIWLVLLFWAYFACSLGTSDLLMCMIHLKRAIFSFLFAATSSLKSSWFCASVNTKSFRPSQLSNK